MRFRSPVKWLKDIGLRERELLLELCLVAAGLGRLLAVIQRSVLPGHLQHEWLPRHGQHIWFSAVL